MQSILYSSIRGGEGNNLGVTEMDLTYTQSGMFTRFMPETTAGEDAWREMASKMDGVAAVLNFQAKAVISQLRAAGYKVGKAKPVTKKEMNDIYAELKALGI